jgi:16S rRNA (cytidine1402-2'-O)-methyltransferase
VVFFESPRRLAVTLAGLAAAFGADRRAAVCRELTKTHEEVIRDSLGDLAQRAQAGLLGEVTIVVEGASRASVMTPQEAAAHVRAREQAGEPRKTAIAAVASEHGLPRRAVYDAVLLSLRDDPPAAPSRAD